MLTTLLLQRILRHRVVQPFPEEGTYHDRWCRDRRRRRLNAQWRRRALSPCREKSRTKRSWSPDPPEIVVTDEYGGELRENFPVHKPLMIVWEVVEEGSPVADKDLLQVPGRKIKESHLSSRTSTKPIKQGAVSRNGERSSHSEPFSPTRQMHVDRHYVEQEHIVSSVGKQHKADRRENAARENSHGDHYRLHETSASVNSWHSTSARSWQNGVSYSEERKSNREESSVGRQRHFDRHNVKGEFVPSTGQRYKANEERENAARESNYGDGYLSSITVEKGKESRENYPTVKPSTRAGEESEGDKIESRLANKDLHEEPGQEIDKSHFGSSSLISKQSLLSLIEKGKSYIEACGLERQSFHRHYDEEHSVTSESHLDKVEVMEDNNGDRHRLGHRPVSAKNSEEHAEFSHNSSQPKPLTRLGDLSEDSTTQRSLVYEDSCREIKGSHLEITSVTSGHSKVSLSEERKSHFESTTLQQERQRHIDYVEEETVSSINQRDEAGRWGNDLSDKHRLRHTPVSVYNYKDGTEYRYKSLPSKSLTMAREVSEGGRVEESPVDKGLHEFAGNKIHKSSLTGMSATSRQSTVSTSEERKAHFESSTLQQEKQRHFDGYYVGEDISSVSQQDKGERRENNHSNDYHLRHTPVSVYSYKDGTEYRYKSLPSKRLTMATEVSTCDKTEESLYDQHLNQDSGKKIHTSSFESTSVASRYSKVSVREERTSSFEFDTSQQEQQRHFDRHYVEEDEVVSSVSRMDKADKRESNHLDEYRLSHTSINTNSSDDATKFEDTFPADLPRTSLGEASRKDEVDRKHVDKDLLEDQGNRRPKSHSDSTSTRSRHSEVSLTEDGESFLETSSSMGQGHFYRYYLDKREGDKQWENAATLRKERMSRFDAFSSERQEHGYNDYDEFASSISQGGKLEERENNRGNGYRLRLIPIPVKNSEDRTEEDKLHPEPLSPESQRHFYRYYVEKESVHSESREEEVVEERQNVARENQYGDKSRLKHTPVRVALREVYTDKWRQYMDVSQEVNSAKTYDDEESRQRDGGTYVSQRTVKLRKESDDVWQDNQPETYNGKPSYLYQGEAYTEGGELEEYKDQDDENEDVIHRSVLEGDDAEDEDRESFLEEWSSLRYSNATATDFAEWSWLLTSRGLRQGQDVLDDGERSYNSADFLSRHNRHLMDLVDGFDDEQLSRLEWFLRQVHALEEDSNSFIDRRLYDYREFRADLEHVARLFFDVELRDIEFPTMATEDGHNYYLFDEESTSDLETIPESDHEYDEDEDYELTPPPAPLTSSRVDLHNISTTTKGLRRWDSRDSAIGSSVGGTLRSWGSQSTMDGTDSSGGYRLSSDSDVFYFGDMSKYGRNSFGSTPYLSRESYC